MQLVMGRDVADEELVWIREWADHTNLSADRGRNDALPCA
jgi:hypothetical protein